MANDSDKLSDQVIDYIKFNGPTTATDLAKYFGVTPMGIRQHLHIHMQNGLLDYIEQAAERGRPKRVWQLSPKAQARYPDCHATLLCSLVDDLAQRLEKSSYQSIVQHVVLGRFASLSQQLAEQQNTADLEQLLKNLKRGMEANGYCCNYAKAGESAFYWYEFHCPILAVSQRCLEVGHLERHKMTHILGEHYQVQILSHLLDGHYRTEQLILQKDPSCN